MFKRKSWNRRWLAFMALCVFLISVSLPPTLTLALQSPARVGVIDLLFNTPETGNGNAADWLSGVVMRKGGKDVNVAIAPASGKPAPHIEFADVFKLGPASTVKGVSIPTKGTIDNPLSVLGKRWVVGTKQLVKGGGFGPLKCAGPLGCLEPAGRKVVNLGTDSPDEFKLVLIKISPNENVAIFEAYIRACLKFRRRWKTCTPYSIPTGFIISVPVRTMMPIDLSVPAFSFKLSPATIANVNSILSKQNLIQASAGVVTSLSSGNSGVVRGVGGPSSSSIGQSGSSSGYAGAFNGKSMDPVSFPKTSGYGLRTSPCNECSKDHKGIDYGAPSGTTVLSAAEGKIVYQGWIKGYGNTIFVDHGNGYMTQYSHLQDGGFLGRTGGNVQMGSPIGISGATGVGTGPHLHFGVLKDTVNGNIYSGSYMNPLEFLRNK